MNGNEYTDGGMPRSTHEHLLNVLSNQTTSRGASYHRKDDIENVPHSRNTRFTSQGSKVSETPNREPSPHILRERTFNRNIEPFESKDMQQPKQFAMNGNSFNRKDVELIDTQLLQASMLNVGDFLPTQNSPEAQSVGASSLAENFNPKQRYFKQSFLQNLQSIKTTIVQCQEVATFLTNKQSSKLKELSELRQRQTQLQCQLDTCWQQGRQELGRVRTELAKVDERERRVDQRWLQEDTRLSSEIEIKESYLRELREQYKQQPSFKHSESDPQKSRVDSTKLIELKKRQSMLKVQLHHAKSAKEQVQSYYEQSKEELAMTQEDLVCRELQLVKLVQQREELEQLMDSTRSQCGPEYDIYERLTELEGNERKQQKHADLLAKIGAQSKEKSASKADRDKVQERINEMKRELDSLLNFQYMTQLVYMFEANNQPISSPTSSVFSSFSSSQASSRAASPTKSARNVSAVATLQSFLNAERQSLLRPVTEDDVAETIAKIQPPQKLDRVQLSEYKRQMALTLEQKRSMLSKLTSRVTVIQEKVNYALSQKSVLRAQIEGLERVLADCEEQLKRVADQVQQLSQIDQTIKVSINEERNQLDQKKKALGEQKMQEESENWHQMKERDLGTTEKQIAQLRAVLKKVKGDYETARALLKQQRQALIDAVDQLSSQREQAPGDQRTSESQIRAALQQVDRQLGQVLIEKADIQEQLTGLKAKMKEARQQFAQGYKAYRAALGSCGASIELPKMLKVEQDSIMTDTEESLQAVSPKVVRSEVKKPPVIIPPIVFNQAENMKLNSLMANNIFAEEMDHVDQEQKEMGVGFVKVTPKKSLRYQEISPEHKLCDEEASSPSSNQIATAKQRHDLGWPKLDYLLNLRPMNDSQTSSLQSSHGRKQPKLSIQIPQNLPDQRLMIVNQTEPSPERQPRQQNFMVDDNDTSQLGRHSVNTQSHKHLAHVNWLQIQDQMQIHDMADVDYQVERTAVKQETHAVVIEDQAPEKTESKDGTLAYELGNDDLYDEQAEQRSITLLQQFEESKRLNISSRQSLHTMQPARQTVGCGLLSLPVTQQNHSPQIQAAQDHEISPADVILMPPRRSARDQTSTVQVTRQSVPSRRGTASNYNETMMMAYHEMQTSNGLASSVSQHSRETRVSPRHAGGRPPSAQHLDQALADSHRHVQYSHRPLMETVQTPCMDQTANMLLYQQDFQNEVFQENRSESSFSNSQSVSCSRSLSQTRRQQAKQPFAAQYQGSLELSHSHFSQGDLTAQDTANASQQDLAIHHMHSQQDSCSGFAQEVAASNNKHHRVDTFQQQELSGTNTMIYQDRNLHQAVPVTSFENQQQRSMIPLEESRNLNEDVSHVMGQGLLEQHEQVRDSESASYQTREFSYMHSAEQTKQCLQDQVLPQKDQSQVIMRVARPNFTSNDSSPALVLAAPSRFNGAQDEHIYAPSHLHKPSQNPMISPTTTNNQVSPQPPILNQLMTQEVQPEICDTLSQVLSCDEQQAEPNEDSLYRLISNNEGAIDGEGSIKMMLSELLDLQSLQNDLEKLPHSIHNVTQEHSMQHQVHEEQVSQREKALRGQIRQLLLTSMRADSQDGQHAQQMVDPVNMHQRNYDGPMPCIRGMDLQAAHQYGTAQTALPARHNGSMLNVSDLLVRSGRVAGGGAGQFSQPCQKQAAPQVIYGTERDCSQFSEVQPQQFMHHQSRSRSDSSSSSSTSSDEDVQPVLGMDTGGQLYAQLRQRHLEASMQSHKTDQRSMSSYSESTHQHINSQKGRGHVPPDVTSWESNSAARSTHKPKKKQVPARPKSSLQPAEHSHSRRSSAQKKPMVRRSGASISINLKTSQPKEYVSKAATRIANQIKQSQNSSHKPKQQLNPSHSQTRMAVADQTIQIAPQTNYKLLMPLKQAQSPRSWLEPLLKGTNFYKKFSSNGQTTMVTNSTPCFDPLSADRMAPEACGYGLRLLRVDPTFKYIKVTHLLRKNITESVLPIADIARVIVPQQTTEMIKIQRAALSDDIDSYSQLFDEHGADADDASPILERLKIFSEGHKPQQPSSIQHLAKLGMLSAKPSASKEIAEVVVRKCRDTTFYPFSLALKADGAGRLAHKRQPSSLSQQAIRQTGRIDLIATSYDNYFDWVHGLTWIIQHKSDDLAKYLTTHEHSPYQKK